MCDDEDMMKKRIGHITNSHGYNEHLIQLLVTVQKYWKLFSLSSEAFFSTPNTRNNLHKYWVLIHGYQQLFIRQRIAHLGLFFSRIASTMTSDYYLWMIPASVCERSMAVVIPR
ncbi:hypothetical protein CEXT_17811 [Caerostris extrusa]|uniref:Uncharacterized protein n=1 Tax=Caerostris extrusa TaxID=172846 RepID=A0AAV4PXS5_CAEEX|nr:hypothetical protein CEXT_17811 [Caerostris extrusa]